jgi:uncharacterized protein (DUF983 family)
MNRIIRMAVRALVLRCPNCGKVPVFLSWFRMREQCPACGLHMERKEEGYTVGAYMFNIVAVELIWVAVFVGAIVVQWPEPSWDLLLYGSGGLMVLLPFVTYPFSKTLFLALDLAVRPAGTADVTRLVGE